MLSRRPKNIILLCKPGSGDKLISSCKLIKIGRLLLAEVICRLLIKSLLHLLRVVGLVEPVALTLGTHELPLLLRAGVSAITKPRGSTHKATALVVCIIIGLVVVLITIALVVSVYCA